MNCPYCENKSKVNNSRPHHKKHAVWRRRQCKSCSAIWTTDEKYDLSTTHTVSKPPKNDLEPFHRDILFMTIVDSLKHRKQYIQEASALTDTVINKIFLKKNPIIESDDIIKISYSVLRSFNQTAAEVYLATRSNYL